MGLPRRRRDADRRAEASRPHKTCQNGRVADNAGEKAQKTRYVDKGRPTTNPDDHAVSELATDRVGALSPYGDVIFPLPADDLPYVHPVTVVNR
jgi:hypothetical protein